jgi:predicted nucleotidyltransferase
MGGSSGLKQEFERREVAEDVFLRVLGEAASALDEGEVPYAVVGGIGSAVFGRSRWTQDVDLLIRKQDSQKILDLLAQRHFEPTPTQHSWLLKAVKEDVLVDLIFSAKGGIYLDDEMRARIRAIDFNGIRLKVAPPEDLVVMKAIAHDQDTPRYWHDALGIVAHTELDWDYLLRRARIGPRRVLSLLLHAQSDDLIVPDRVIRKLYDSIYAAA